MCGDANISEYPTPTPRNDVSPNFQPNPSADWFPSDDPMTVTDPAPANTPELDLLTKSTDGKKPKDLAFEPLSQVTFAVAYNNLAWAADDPAGDIPGGWNEVAQGIASAKDDFQTQWASADSGADAWIGKTHDAVWKNISASFDILDKMSSTAANLGTLAGSFSRIIGTTKNEIVSNAAGYESSKNSERWSDYKRQYDSFAQKVMTTVYQPKISDIAKNNPDFNFGSQPTVNSTTDFGGNRTGFDGTPTNFGATPTGFGAGGGAAGSFGTSKLADLANFSTPQESLASSQLPTDLSGATATPTSAQSGLDGLNALAGPAQNLASPLQSLGQLANMAQRGNPGGALGALPKLPAEGALKGLKPGGGAGGGGAGLRGVPPSKSAGAPSTAAVNKSAPVMAAGSRAGLSGAAGAGAMGAPGAGAPGAGHQGGPGGAHQPSKALRRKKNGELLIGEAEAVVPVLGEPARTEPAKQEAT
ncbi:hypothetical protein ACQI5H_20150 [Mycobacterium heidelbergense]|uniref:hypothetical protein n=1 Tax=Mycobacterium heidelbergense TaxID=53376 RepID=UPI003CEA3637